jgi:NaMN:DMB phosphoribosyltransferase
MSDIEIHCNEEKGQKFIKSVERKHFLFSFVISYTETSEIPGITVAGADPNFIKFTPPADAEFLHYGFCKSIDVIPMTPDGKPTPALLTKTALQSASIPQVVINAGSKIPPKLPYFETSLPFGKNISVEPGLDKSSVVHAVDYGKIVGRILALCTDCLVIAL